MKSDFYKGGRGIVTLPPPSSATAATSILGFESTLQFKHTECEITGRFLGREEEPTPREWGANLLFGQIFYGKLHENKEKLCIERRRFLSMRTLTKSDNYR